MLIKFSIIGITLEQTRKEAERALFKFLGEDYSPYLQSVRAVPDEVLTETTIGGHASSEILSWEVFFECRV